MLCKNCQAALAVGVTICPNCGANQLEEEKVKLPGRMEYINSNNLKNNQDYMKPQDEKSVIGKGVIIVIVALLIVIVIVLLKVFNN